METINTATEDTDTTSTFGVNEQQQEVDSFGTNTPLFSLFDSATECRDGSLSEISTGSPPPTNSQAACDDSCSEISDSALSVDIVAALGDTELWQEKLRDETVTQPTVPMELIHPELRNVIPSPGCVKCAAAKPVSSKGEAYKTTAIDEEEDIWEVEALLAKWKQGKRILYLVKWKGFPDEANTWENKRDIDPELVEKFDTDYKENGGNLIGVEVVDVRVQRGTIEYLVKWKGRSNAENSWEKGSTISPELTQTFRPPPPLSRPRGRGRQTAPR